jgi:hypothetical protein
MLSASSRALAVFAAVLVVLVGVGSASAARLSLSQRTFSASWIPREPITENMTIREEFGVLVICEFSVSGSFHAATFAKVASALIGYINSASLGGECPARVLRETLPWHVRYRNFTGTLPNPLGIGISVTGLSLRAPELRGECLFRSEATNPALFTINLGSGVMRTISAAEGARIPGSGLCAFNNFTLRGTGGFTGITVRLI